MFLFSFFIANTDFGQRWRRIASPSVALCAFNCETRYSNIPSAGNNRRIIFVRVNVSKTIEPMGVRGGGKGAHAPMDLDVCKMFVFYGE